MSIMNPAVAGQAFDEFLAEIATRDAHESWTPADGALPALFLSHGAPPVFDDGLWIAQLSRWARSIPKPTGIVVVSAHWEQAPLLLSATAAHTPLIYDFGGFHPRYYEMTYDTPDASALGQQIASLIPDEMPFAQAPNRGLDHGAWVPLKVMYPSGDIPVVQLSLPSQDPRALFDLGQRLQALRDHGILVIGSGFMTHGLPYLTGENFQHNTVPTWSAEFDRWAEETIAAKDLDTLFNYKSSAPGLPYAHPTVEHFTPLFLSLGLSTEDRTETAIDGFQFGLSKRSLTIW